VRLAFDQLCTIFDLPTAAGPAPLRWAMIVGGVIALKPANQ